MIRILAAMVAIGGLALPASALGDGAFACKETSKRLCQGKQYCCYEGSEKKGASLCIELGCDLGAPVAKCPENHKVTPVCGTKQDPG